jgi:glycosyltransferase involved in cell wall biosynthesis
MHGLSKSPKNTPFSPPTMDEPRTTVLIPQADPRKEMQRPGVPKLSVLLVGNYVPDAQQSMQRFASVMAAELAALGVEVSVIRPEPFFGRLHPGATGFGKWLGYLDKFFVFPRVLRKKLSTLKSQASTDLVVHICDHSNAFYTRYLRDVPHVVTCHDMLAVRSALGEIPQNPTRWSGRRLQRIILNGMHSSENIACVSESTRRDLCRLVEQATLRCIVVEMGQNNTFAPVPLGQARARVLEMARQVGHAPPPGVRYVVHVGGEQWYKNRKGVVEIFCELRRSSDQEDLWLFMVGKPLSGELKALIDEAGLSERVVELPSVSHEDLCSIYSASELLLFPSLQEGFGWPIIEAEACGCRVVTTARPPMNDVGGEAAAYVEPEDIPTSLDVLLNVLYEDESQREARVARGFANAAKYATKRMIDVYLALYGRAIERKLCATVTNN